jgi:hypothetical protein
VKTISDANANVVAGIGDAGSDTKRIDSLAELIQRCPHAEISFSDDPDTDEGDCGFFIRVEGCDTVEACGRTFREAIDKFNEALHGEAKEAA